MSNSDGLGFGKFVPGFDFLQNLAKDSASAMPGMAQWVAPTLSVEDLEKRIEELKHVQFWLEQNTRALSATIQALEVQKLTLATLQGMNFSMPSAPAAPTPEPPAPPKPQASTSTPPSASTPPPAQDNAAPDSTAPDAKANAPAVDPLQLWSALTQQFQTIAAAALKDVASKAAPGTPAKTPSSTKSPTKASTKAAPKAPRSSGKPASPSKAKAHGSAAAPRKPRAV
jgi:hypothetical protein